MAGPSQSLAAPPCPASARSHTSSSTAGVPLWGSSLLSLSDSLSTSWPSPITVSPSSTAMARGSGGARKLQDPGHAWLRTRPQISKAEGRVRCQGLVSHLAPV
ncbi:hypothetical protein F751_4862 [Auxenochlorella protothecoides]|uniref:Uncharacterized protein n=1 Tax=Auxenochlorella protothecoides TaxID=3075 RepID=A0A087SKW5_AUXPR|nr:hypothetical protein F751_4862 [Auxenochlorella protothecoides]KFM26369.1 hypothetical protein F751_4862 [Auxenochlorella protothecoides]